MAAVRKSAMSSDQILGVSPTFTSVSPFCRSQEASADEDLKYSVGRELKLSGLEGVMFFAIHPGDAASDQGVFATTRCLSPESFNGPVCARIPMSYPSPIRSTYRLAASTRTLTPGYFARNFGSNGARANCATAIEHESRKVPETPVARLTIACSASRACRPISSANGKSSFPASVSEWLRDVLRSNPVPTARSSDATRWLIVDFGIPSAREAAL